MAVSFLNLVDDDGSNTVGTLVDKAQLQLLLRGSFVTSTATGAVNNWAPPVDGHTFIDWNGAADATFSGLAAGLVGLTATVKNITTTKVAYFLHQSGLSSAGNKFTNSATSAATPVAPGGWITYRYDGTDWQLVTHEQGAWVTPTFAAGSYTASAGTWTLTAGDVTTNRYRLSGRTLQWIVSLATTSVSNAGVTLLAALPGGFTAVGTTLVSPTRSSDNGGALVVGAAYIPAGTTVNFFSTFLGGNYAISVNLTSIDAVINLEVA
jgi:hypothetical protein